MWAVQVALAACLLAPSAAFFFESGFSHHYTYWAENSLFDKHDFNVTTVLKFQVNAINQSEKGHTLHSLTVDSLVQYVKDGVLMNNPMKWDLSKTFLFVSEDTGNIRLVHCHPEDHEELVVIKKAMVSVFAVHVKIEEDKDEWDYTVHEHDHLGSLSHDYKVKRTDTGLKLNRKHFSSDHAFRTHEKTLHYDHQGTLHTAVVTDHVLLKDRSPKHKPSDLPGMKPHIIHSSGDFPHIEARATVKVTLEGKRPRQGPQQLLFHNLTAQTLETKLKPEPSVSLSAVKKNISRVFQCVDQFPQKDSENRSICVNDLRNILKRLHKTDYTHFVDSILGTRCPDNGTSCEDHRLIVIDVVTRMGDMTSQELIVKHVLSREPAVDEELRRVFIHSVAIENPIESLIQRLETLCFGSDGQHHGSRNMTRTQSRACLAVGSVARHVHHSGNTTRADRLLDRLESWLDHHATGDPHISKRSTWLEETVHEDHHLSKGVLLHALGNAALPRSRRHLLEHATPNRGHQLWRRAALDAMRRYNCTETAKVMLACLMHDDKHTVRQMALSVYVKHPQRHEVSRDHENAILSEKYTYPTIARVKRSMFDSVLFKFKLALPTLDWKKELGSKAVGASFGLYFENGIDALFRVLSGYVDVTVHDKVWAEVHLGLIGKQWDILLAEVCYKGRLSYNMNIVKDFTVGMMKDISSAFDHIANRIIEPMEKTANDLANRFQDNVSGQPKSGFEPVATAVKNLPKTTERALSSTVALSDIAESVTGLPLVSRLQQLSTRAQSLMEDVHTEATDLFSNIKDAAVVALPFAEKEIRNSLNTVLDKLGSVSEHPRQTFSFIERSKMGYQLAMQRVLESNKIIKQATAFLSGSRSSFMNSGQELKDIAESTRLLVQRLRADHARRKRQANPWEEVGETVDAMMDAALEDVLDRAETMAANLDSTTNSSKELQEAFDQQALYTEVLKTSYQAFKEAIDMVKSRISALFGQKFHPKFPDQRRDCDDRCKCGYYPTECTRYGHPGIDLKWDPGWKIVSPVAGLAKPAGNNAISIKPSTAGFTDYEIILSNIRLSVSINASGTYIDAGQNIGTPVGHNGCEDSHFNLAMKRIAPDSDTGLCYYVDPSPFIDRMQPVPKWHQECKDFTFKHIGDVVDFSKLTEGFAQIFEELKRFALEVGKGLLMKVVDAMPDLGFLGPLKDIAGDIVKGLDLDPANLQNLFKDAATNMKDFFGNIGLKNFNLNGVLNMAGKLPGLGNLPLGLSLGKVTGFIGKARDLIRNPPIGALKSLASGGIGRLLSSRGIMSALPALGLGSLPGIKLPSLGQGCGGSGILNAGADKVDSLLGQATNQLGSVFGQQGSGLLSGLTSKVTSFVSGRAGMMSALRSSACNACPAFGSALSRWTGSSCVPHEDCLGLDCDVTLKRIVTAKVDLHLRVHLDQRKVTVTVNGKVQEITGNASKTVAAQIKVFNIFNVKLKVGAFWHGRELQFSLSVAACAPMLCLPDIAVVSGITFKVSSRHKRSAEEILGPFMSSMESLPLDDVGKMFSDFNLPMEDMMDQMSGIQDQISSALEPNEDRAEPSMSAEFINPTDHKDEGSFPIQGQNGEQYMPFFIFVYVYPLGPLIFRMDFDAGGAFGISFDVKVKALDSMLRTEIKPWVSGKFRASMSISIVVASAGIDLIGWVMKTGFPLTLSTNYNKQPVVTTKALEIELIPLELKLKGWVKILWVINLKKVIWEYKAPALRGTIWEKVYRKDDQGPPRFPYCDRACNSGRRRRQIRSSGAGCTVHQVKGRHPKDAAFKLEFAVEDEDSDLDLFYAVGDYPGGTNVQGWTPMRGSSLLSPAQLPCGIPLHFVVKARNSQGLETTARCSIPTFDCTFPDGRVDAAHRCTSHPSTLKSQVILFEDSALLPNNLYHGVGYSPSSFGHEVVDWQTLTLSNSRPQTGVSGDLRYFGVPRPGRLSSTPKTSSSASTVGGCASQCVKMTTCVTFVYNQYLHTCELHEITEGANAERKSDRHHQTYERLGKSYTATLRYEHLPLRHGTKYYVNADIENVLGYRATLTSQGTMVDRTPPEPGPVGRVMSDNVTADGCHVSILQRCVDHVAGSLNHRKIVDGSDSRTVFTGNRKGQEMSYTIENYHAAANWDGFKDEECGIHGYSWSVGTHLCGSDIANFVDPHSTIHNPDDWTYTGLAKDLHLPDGAYYVTVQAISDIVHGGDLVTTVCHSTPFTVDTTPPDFNAVEEFLFDESFRYLVVYYNVSDHRSGVARMEFGLGKTKYDVMIRRYLTFPMRGVEGNTYLVNEEFETEDGVPAWIRLKVVNNVGLSATGSSDAPILLDSSPPIPGDVMDGSRLGQDICCQMSTTRICAQWVDFHDPDSHIDSFYWGVGLTPGKDDVVTFHILSSYDKQSCVDVALQHNVTYFSTVVADNKALNTKSANSTSDGLLIDITPPVAGTVSDGNDVNHDVNYTSETATVATSWAGFYDSESGLADYTVSVIVNDALDKAFTGVSSELQEFTDHSFSLQHGDSVMVQLQANNRAGNQVTMTTDGMLVDHTPPALVDIGTVNRSLYQQRDDALHFVWDFEDPESGVGEYRCVVLQLYQGRKTKFWPQLSDFHPIHLNMTSATHEDLNLQGLSLQNGASYSVKVTALNRAKMATAEESEGVTVDTTPPVILTVSLAKEGEEEEVNENDVVEHVDKEPLWITWSPHDSESGVKQSRLCVGPAGSSDCLFNGQALTVDASSPSTLALRDLNLQVSTDEQEVLYQAYILVINGAGVQSAVAMSKPFLVLKANIAGVVVDGRSTEDVDYSHDKASIAITFSGFSSEACGIVGYEWGIGTSPFATDVLPYTDYGLVVDDTGKGFAQVHIMQFEGQKYFSTVRAKTGHNCHEEYIVSSSDGFTVDTTPPSVSFRVDTREVAAQEVVYQTTSDHLDVLWLAQDASGLNDTRMVQDIFDSTPHATHVQAVPEEPLTLRNNPSSGDSLFSFLIMTDNAGNEKTVHMPPVTWDMTPPSFLHLSCSKVVSSRASLLSCQWDTVQEPHSALSQILIGLGNGPSVPNLMNMTSVPGHSRKWNHDVYDLLQASHLRYFYVFVRAINAAGLQTEVSLKVINDVSPPSVDDVIVVTSPRSGFHDVKQQCQTAQDYVEVFLPGVLDPESDIRSVELSLGSSGGLRDVSSFRESGMVDGMYVMDNLALSPGAIVYITARVTNHVGLYVIKMSEPVVISPEPYLQVTDGPGEVDIDGQSKVHVLEGRWRYSDPCPVVQAEWSVVELSGETFTNFTHIDTDNNLFYNDGLHLRNFITYINYIRIRDALNRTRTAYSDGVTVLIRLPDTAPVRDGPGETDMDFQQATDTLTANWDSFGDSRSTLPSDHIVRYAAAVGTDRGVSSTRSNVHAFVDVSLANNITFYGLNLTAKLLTYYVTVRAYSAAGSYVESSSDGIQVGFSGDVITGQVQVHGFQSSTSSIRVSWIGFDSDMVITHYYAGVGSLPASVDNDTHDCSVLMPELARVLDVRDLRVVQDEAMTVLDQLDLNHGASYYVTVVAADKMGHCSAAVSGPIVVDITPPVQGQVKAEGYNADTVIFLHSLDSVTVVLEEFPDPESGVDSVSLALLSSPTCTLDLSSEENQVIRTVEAKNETNVTIRNLQLEENTLYFVRVTVTNGAGLSRQVVSAPILVDSTPPEAGLVRLGADWTQADQTFQQHTHTVSGLLALQSLSSSQTCETQTDLLAKDRIKDWTSHKQFSSRCMGFDYSGLHVMVEHNPYLTGMERGAAQYGPMGWREGDYTFHLTPTAGEHIISGISLASPTLHPPFSLQNGLLPGNQSSLPCDPSEGVCLEDRNQTTKSGQLGANTDYGLGLTFQKTDSGTKLLFWAQDVLQLKQMWIPLDFDPVGTAADYTLRLYKRRESGSELWEVVVIIDGQDRASVSGLLLADQFVVTVYGFNVDDYMPPVVDQFQPFKAAVLLGAVSVPVQQRPLCSYGSAFWDRLSDVKEVWVGVSDSYNDTANVAPYTLIKSYCLPCLHSCPRICSSCTAEHLSKDFTVIPFVLQGLNLLAGDEIFANSSLNSTDPGNSTTDVTTSLDNDTALSSAKRDFKDYQLPTYYLDVRVVDHGGLETHVKSVGLVIDTSPPQFKSLNCFDPDFSSDAEITQLGNNHTVGVTWELSEDISDITTVRVYLGTRPGSENIVRKVTVSQDQDQYVFKDLGSVLKEDSEYYISVEAENEAGLHSQQWVNFTVHTAPPDMSAMDLKVGNVTSVQLGDVTVGLLEDTDNMELSLDLDPALLGGLDVEYYELAIGTAAGKDDVFPKTVVGQKGAKKISIVHGYVQRDESLMKISIGDYTKKNVSTNELPDPSANLFRMEPGRCLSQTVYGVSKAHVATSFDVMPVCVKRGGDVMVGADGKGHVLKQSGSVFTLDQQQNVTTPALNVYFKLKKGGVMAGVLTTADLTQEYGTAASAQFSPFIVWPDPVNGPTSRWLKKRLKTMPGPHSFMSPVADAQFEEDVVVTYTVPASLTITQDTSVSLVMWNPDTKEWEAPEERCDTTSQSYNNATRIITARICAEMFSNTTFSSQRKKRSTSQFSGPPAITVGPRMLTVAVITSSVPNQPPVIRNTTFTLIEDHGMYNFTLTYTDPEGDDMTFWLPRQPDHGAASITSEGKITYVPDPNFTGTDLIYVKGKEVLSASSLALGLVANEISFTVTVHVTGVNDPPDIFYLPEDNSTGIQQEIAVGPTSGNGLNMTVYKQANTSTSDVLGLVVFSDVDHNDVINFTSVSAVQPGVTFIEHDISSSDARLSDVNVSSSTGISGKEITLNSPKHYVGHVTYNARVKDTAGSFSMQLTLNTFVLLNPCVHGDCRPRDPQGTCYEPQRAFTFDPYQCHCDLGYEGEWCQTETDECRTATCSPITDCVDLIGRHRCDVNPTKLAAIVVCSVLAVTLAVFAVVRLRKRYCKSSKVGVTGIDEPDDLKKPPPFIVDQSEERLQTCRTVSDVRFEAPTPESEAPRGDFEFMNDPVFAYKPTQNPAFTRIAALGKGSESGGDTSSVLLDAAPATTAFPKGKQLAPGKPATKGKGPGKKSTPSTKGKVSPILPPTTDAAIHAENIVRGSTSESDDARRPDSSRPGSTLSGRHSTITGGGVDRNMTKVEN